MFFLPTIEEARQMVAENECFIEKREMVHGHEVIMFNYLLAVYNDFANPIKESPEKTAFELRGLTFVKQNDGSYKRFLMLHKFFNLNQCKNYMYEDLKDEEIIDVADKLDGSMMSFIDLPCGKIVAKTKMAFFNDQTGLGNDFYEVNENYREFIKECLKQRIAPIFELTSPLNRIVLKYDKTHLTLLRLRDQETGEYLDIRKSELAKKYNISLAEAYIIPEKYKVGSVIDSLLEMKKYQEDIEGVIVATPKCLYKVKTDWYMENHSLLTDVLARENKLAEIILEEKIDDVLGTLDKDDNRRDMLNVLSEKMTKYVHAKTAEALTFLTETYTGDRKEFGIKYNKHELFKFTVRATSLEEKDARKQSIFEHVMKDVTQRTLKLERARIFFEEELDFTLVEYFKNLEEF